MDKDPKQKTPSQSDNGTPHEEGNHFREQVRTTFDARNVIADILNDETYFEYAVHDGQICIQDVDSRIRHSEAFQQFLRVYGWPNAKEDNGIEPPHQYGDLHEPDYDAFLDGLLSRSVTLNEKGELKADRDADLNNFRLWLIAEPRETPFAGASMVDALYATHPALHRLYVIMPELMVSVQKLVKDMYDRNPDQAKFSKEISAGVNEDLVKAIYLVYQIAGRLLKSDDGQRHRSIVGLPGVSAKIIDAHETLRA